MLRPMPWLSHDLRPLFLGLAILELRIIELSVEAVLGKELVVRAGFHDVAVAQHQDHVGIADGAQAVRDHEARATLHEGIHGALDALLGARVHVGSCLVQDEDGAVGDERARDGEKLLLSSLSSKS